MQENNRVPITDGGVTHFAVPGYGRDCLQPKSCLAWHCFSRDSKPAKRGLEV
jgi:hypothetical protein